MVLEMRGAGVFVRPGDVSVPVDRLHDPSRAADFEGRVADVTRVQQFAVFEQVHRVAGPVVGGPGVDNAAVVVHQVGGGGTQRGEQVVALERLPLFGDVDGGHVGVDGPVVVDYAQAHGEGSHGGGRVVGRGAGGVVVLAVGVEVPLVEGDRAIGVGRARSVQRNRAADCARVGSAGFGGGGDVRRGDVDGGRVEIGGSLVVGDAQAHGERSHGGSRVVGRGAGGVVVLAVGVEVPLVQRDCAVRVGRGGAVQCDGVARLSRVGSAGLGRGRVVLAGRISIPYQADIVEDSLHVALGTWADHRVTGRVAILRVAALAAGAVNVGDGRTVERSRAASEAEIGTGAGRAVGAQVRGSGPVPRVVLLAGHVGDGGTVEHRVDRGRRGRIGRASVVHQTLKLLGVGQPPVVIPGESGVLRAGKRVFPVHAASAVSLRPHQRRGAVRHGSVAARREVVRTVVGVAADEVGVERLLASHRIGHTVTLDSPVCKVHAEHHAVVRDVECAGDPL